jgi:BirA family transcriptional regulator, biotin operon repressor / biotin---[acetyl-CoA-carboxylase] ligase
MSLFFGNKMIKLQSIDSTNNYATARMYAEDWQEGTVVQADFQSNGKGQPGNYWESEKDKNLLCSIALKPCFLPIRNQFLISKAISLSVMNVVENYVAEVMVKWPNDIYVGQRKIAGILIENSILGNSLEYSIAGIGLNINQLEFCSDAPNPVSLAQLTRQHYPVEVLLNELLFYFEKWYSDLKSGQIEKVNHAYEERLYQLGILACYRDRYGTFSGRILGVNPIGQLRVEDNEKKIREYHFKEITFLP